MRLRLPPVLRPTTNQSLRHGLKSCCFMPIFASGGKALGAFANYRRQPGDRELSHMQLLQVATHLAGIAIERKQAQAALQESRIQLTRELAAVTHLHELVARLLTCPGLHAALDEVLEATVTIPGAEMGTVQLFDPSSKTLEIVAQRGFSEDFLDHFRTVKIDEETACGRAIRSGERVVIEDAQANALHDPYRRAAASAGFRAVQSTPLLGHAHKPLGVFSTHYRQPHRPSEHGLRLLDLYTRQAADFIERIRGEEALRQAGRRKDEFLATLAHELRNSLAPLRTGLEVMRMAGDNQALAEEVRTMMEGQIQQLVRLVDDLLDTSRITRGKIALRKEQVELTHAVQSTVEATRPLIEESGHELTVTLPPQPIFLQADSVRLTQIFSNLLTNAARYTPDGGRIWLAADRLESIFEMFTQVDQSLERRHKGLGIGLTLVKQLAKMHGGSVEARSSGQAKAANLSFACQSKPGRFRRDSKGMTRTLLH